MVRWAKNPPCVPSFTIHHVTLIHIIPQYIELVIDCYISFCLGSDESSYPRRITQYEVI